MLRIGLTGSIGVGKSFVSSVLKELGCFVLDADTLARTVVEPGTPGLHALSETFGQNVIAPDGSLDRSAVSAIVFSDPAKLSVLNSLLHPLILAEQDRILDEMELASSVNVAVVDAALMIESGGYRRFSKLIVVICDPDIQLYRLMNRNGWSREEAFKRINSQMPQEEKVRYADFIIDTSAGFDDTRHQTEKVFLDLLEPGKLGAD